MAMNLRLPENEQHDLDDAAQAEGLSKSDFVRAAVRDRVDQRRHRELVDAASKLMLEKHRRVLDALADR